MRDQTDFELTNLPKVLQAFKHKDYFYLYRELRPFSINGLVIYQALCKQPMDVAYLFLHAFSSY